MGSAISLCDRIMMGWRSGGWLGKRGMPIKPVACLRWRRSTTAALVQRPLASAAGRCRSSSTGSCGLTSAVPMD